MASVNGIIFPLTVFLFWMLTSFFCHKLAKMAVSVHLAGGTTLFKVCAVPLMVTLSQILCCSGAVTMSRQTPLSLLLLAAHALATFATNSSMTLTFASSTLAIKMLEPLSSSVLQKLILRSSLSWQGVVSMLVVVAGAALYVSSPWEDAHVVPAVFLAFISNLALGVRNVTMKMTHGDIYHFKTRSSMLGFSIRLILGLSLLYELEYVLKVLPANVTYFVVLSMGSGVCHVAYNYVSMKVVLKYMTVVSHAVVNILKRVLVVVLLHMTGRRLASPWNWLGLLLCIVGLCFYHRFRSLSSTSTGSKQDMENTAATSFHCRPLTGILVVLVVVHGLCITGVWLHSQTPAFTFASKVHEQTWAATLRERYATSFTDTDISASPILALNSNTTGVLSEISLLKRQLSDDITNTRDYARRLLLGLEKWKDGQFLINQTVTFQPAYKPLHEIIDFLQKKPTATPFDTDGLSPYLTSTKAVIAEAEKIHLNIFHDLLAGKKYVVMLGMASFENKGDPAISVGEVVLLNKLGLQLIFYVDIHQCTQANVIQSLRAAQRYPRHQVAVLMSGGGNLIGYAAENNCRKLAMHNFQSYQLVIMSESVYMRGSQATVNQAVDMYCCNSNLTILLRDRQSLLIARRLFNNGTRLILAPDMAFLNGAVKRFIPPYNDIMWLDRHDGETPVDNKLVNPHLNESIFKGDWMSMPSLSAKLPLHKAVNVLVNGFVILQRGRVVITERLHGHILCLLLDIPHVLLDNADLKLSSYHNTWTRGVRNCRVANSADQALRLANDLLTEYRPTLPDLLPVTKHQLKQA